MVDRIETSRRQARLVENRSDDPEGRRRELGAFQNNRVTASKRLEAGSEAQNVGSVPAKVEPLTCHVL
jgi:hypothetical protein